MNSLDLISQFYESGQTHDVKFRLLQINKLESILRENTKSIYDALKADFGRNHIESLQTELFPIFSQIKIAKKNLAKWTRQHKRKSSKFFPLSRCYLEYQPYGISLIITPWNYPFAANCAALIGSIAAGNCTILRPSQHMKYSLSTLKDIVCKSFPDNNFVHISEASHDELDSLISGGVDYLYFMGRTPTGLALAQKALHSGVPYSLHLGGKCPAIICSDAQIDRSVRRLTWAKFTNAGQSCTAPDYLLVHESIVEQVIYSFKKTLNEFFGPDPIKSPNYSRLKDHCAVERLVELSDKEDVIFGGTSEVEKRYFSPTLILNPKEHSLLRKEEIFGPILPIISFRDISEATSVIRANASPLALYIFSKRRHNLSKFLSVCTTGQVCFNDAMVQASADDASIGGVGLSGTGRHGGFETFKSFSNEKFVFEQTSLFDVWGRFPPHNQLHKKIIEFFM